METLDIAIGKLRRRADARKLDRAIVKSLAASIRELGVINPLRVREITIFESGREAKGFEVIAGSHRLQAGLELGISELPCTVVDDDDLRAELVMIDENLCRAELSPADRAGQTARRKAIYLELHPETAKGVAGGLARQGAATDNMSFAASTAEAIGKDQRTVQRDAARGEAIAADVLNRIRGTHLDNGAYLDRLKVVSIEDQRDRVEKALSAPLPTKHPARALSDAESVEKQFQGIVSAWNRAGPEARDQFKAEYIDTPVMDRRFGS